MIISTVFVYCFIYLIIVEEKKNIFFIVDVILYYFSYLRHLFEYIGTQFPPPSSLLYGKMGSITLFFFKWEY